MFESPRRGRQASKKFYNKCSENSRSQIVFRTDIFRKLSLGAPVTVKTSTVATASKKSNNDRFHPQFAIIVFKMKVPYSLLSRVNNNLSAISHTG